MDGGQVTETTIRKGGGENAPAPLFPYSDLFRKAFPYYLSIGMTYEQFWLGDVELVKYYRQAAKLKREMDNQNAWLQGMYFYEALCDASPLFRTTFKKGKIKPLPYSSKPYELDKKESEPEERGSAGGLAFMQAFMTKNNTKFQRKEGQNG